MFVILDAARNGTFARLAALGILLGLSACGPQVAMGPSTPGGGTVHVALLVPSGSGQASDDLLAQNLENAARLAISDLDGVKVDLKVYSTGAAPDAAAKTAMQAVDEGAQVILGPVYAQAANAAGAAAPPARLPGRASAARRAAPRAHPRSAGPAGPGFQDCVRTG